MGVFGGSRMGSPAAQEWPDLEPLGDYETQDYSIDYAGDSNEEPMEKVRKRAAYAAAINEPDDEKALAIFKQNFSVEDNLGDRIGKAFLGDIWGDPKGDRREQLMRERAFMQRREDIKAGRKGEARADERLSIAGRAADRADKRFKREGDQYEDAMWLEQTRDTRDTQNRALDLVQSMRKNRLEDEGIAEERSRYLSSQATAEEQREERKKERERQFGLDERSVANQEARTKAMATGRGGTVDRALTFTTDKVMESARRDLRADFDAAKARNSQSAIRAVREKGQAIEQAYRRATTLGTEEAHQAFREQVSGLGLGGGDGMGLGFDPNASRLQSMPGSMHEAFKSFTPERKQLLLRSLAQSQSPGQIMSSLSNSGLGVRPPQDMGADEAALWNSERQKLVDGVLEHLSFTPSIMPEKKAMIRDVVRAYLDNPAAGDQQMVQAGEFYQMEAPPQDMGSVPAQEWAASRSWPTWGAGLIASSDYVASLGDAFVPDQLEQTQTNTEAQATVPTPGMENASGHSANLQRRGLNLIGDMTEEFREEVLRRAGTDPQKLIEYVNRGYHTRMVDDRMDRERLQREGPYMSKDVGFNRGIVTSVTDPGVFSFMGYSKWATEQPRSGEEMGLRIRRLEMEKFGWQLANAYVEAVKSQAIPGSFPTYAEKAMPLPQMMGPPQMMR